MKTAESFWRKEDPIVAADGRTITTGGMWDHQRKWWELPNEIKVLVGGYGSGKTIIGCKRAISLALENAPHLVGFVSPTYNLALSTICETMDELLEGKRNLLRGFSFRRKEKTNTYEISYRGRKGRVRVFSGDDHEKLKGPNLAAALIDEPFIQDEAVFTQIAARVRHPGSRKREICLMGTPEQLNWGYDLCEGDLGKRFDVGVVFASSRANLVTGDNYIKRLEGAFTKEAAEAYIEGRFVNLSGGLVLYAFDQHEHIVDADEPPPGARLGFGIDFNVNPMAAVVFWHFGERMHILEEIELKNSDTQAMAEYLKQNWWAAGLRDCYPDASCVQRKTSAPIGRSDQHWLQMAGFTTHFNREGNPPVRDRFECANAMLKPLKGRTRLTISPTCSKLRKYATTYAYATEKKQEHMRHLLDAATYPVAYLFPPARSVAKQKRIIGA